MIERGAVQPDQLTLPTYTDEQTAQVDHRPFGLNGIGQLFFQPLQLHLEATNLLVELSFTLLLRAVMACSSAAKNRASYLQQLALPLTDLERFANLCTVPGFPLARE
jgi:hypothetical protein